jgi:transposase
LLLAASLQAVQIRLINHRGYGHHSAAAVIAMIYLCCSGLTIALPTGR